MLHALLKGLHSPSSLTLDQVWRARLDILVHVLLSTKKFSASVTSLACKSAKAGQYVFTKEVLLAWQVACSTGQTLSVLHALLSTVEIAAPQRLAAQANYCGGAISPKSGMQNCKMLSAWQAACSTGQSLSMLHLLLSTVTPPSIVT